MLMTVARSVAAVLLFAKVVVGLNGPAHSTVVAKQLTTALFEQKLDAIAAKDPDEPDRFVAALFLPDSQLLVVSARYAAPSILESKVAQHQYRDVYLDLQGAAIPSTTVFYQDMKADGLCAGRDMVPDVVFDKGSATPTIFDADWDKHKMSQKAYEQQYIAADQQYSRLLELLLTQLKIQD